MNYFAAVKIATFAEKAFAAAGIDAEAAYKAGNADFLKEHFAKVSGAADVAKIQGALDEALAENARVTAEQSAVISALESVGVKIPAASAKDANGAATAEAKPLAETVAAAVEARAATKAREIVAATGTAPVSESPVADTSRPASAARKEVTHAEFSAMNATQKMNFCKAGGRITELPLKS